MKISIITVCLNSAKTIRQTINSVLSQTYQNIEYIIIDGASNDETCDIVLEYKNNIAQFISEPDKGLYDAINKGISLASGDIVGILNSDDFYENNRVLEDVVNHFKLFSDTDLASGDVVFVRPNDLNKIIRHYNGNHFKSWKLRFGWMPAHPATFIRKSAYDKVGIYALGYKIAADYEMFVRLLLVHKLKYSRINKILVRMRTGGASTIGIRSNITSTQEVVRACRTNGVYTNIFFVLSKVPFKLMEYL